MLRCDSDSDGEAIGKQAANSAGNVVIPNKSYKHRLFNPEMTLVGTYPTGIPKTMWEKRLHVVTHCSTG